MFAGRVSDFRAVGKRSKGGGDACLFAAHRQQKHALLFHAAAEVFGRVGGNKLAFGDDHDRIADGADFGKDMAGKDDRMAVAEAADQVAHFNDLLGVETNRRLVEDQNFRVADHRLRKADALLVAFGEMADQTVGDAGDPRQFHDLLDLHLALGLWHAFQPGGNLEIFARRELGIQRRLFGQIADAAFGRFGVLENVVAVDGHRAGRCGDVAGDDVHRCRLARTVGAEEAVDLTFVDRKTQIVDRVHTAVIGLGQVFYLNQESSPFSFVWRCLRLNSGFPP